MIVSDIGDAYALDEKTGNLLWIAELPDIERILAITNNRVYAQRSAGQLVAIDRTNGKVLASLNRPFARGMSNVKRVNDRILLETETGTILCLREPDAVEPSLNVPLESSKALQKDGDKPAPSSDIMTPGTEPPPSVDSPFGAPNTPDATTPAMDANDPFAAPPANSPPPVDASNRLVFDWIAYIALGVQAFAARVSSC